MQINIHHPVVQRIDTHDEEDHDELFHTVRITDAGGGDITVFIRTDWSDWDELITAVAAYRTETTQ